MGLASRAKREKKTAAAATPATKVVLRRENLGLSGFGRDEESEIEEARMERERLEGGGGEKESDEIVVERRCGRERVRRWPECGRWWNLATASMVWL